jgi:hypothetical protein
MKKNLINEINQMKYMFGYKPGKVISEQNIPTGSTNDVSEMYEDYDTIEIDDFEMSDPDVAEPETKPKTRPSTRPSEPDNDPFPNPFNPDRDFNPLPDAEPQGRRKHHDVFPGLKRTSGSEVNEPYIEDADEVEYELHLDTDLDELMGNTKVDLGNMVSKYLRRKEMVEENETIYEIHLNSNIDELFL